MKLLRALRFGFAGICESGFQCDATNHTLPADSLCHLRICVLVEKTLCQSDGGIIFNMKLCVCVPDCTVPP